MATTRVKQKHQVTLPAEVRRKAGIAVGDLLEAEVKGGRILLTPKVLVDKRLAQAPRDVKEGRVRGPFRDAKAAVDHLQGRRRS